VSARALVEHGGARYQLRACDRVGARPRVLGRARIENLGRIEISDDFELHAEPVTSHLVTGVHGTLTIGNAVIIGHGASIAAHGRVGLGDHVVLGPFAIVMDTDFHQASDHRRVAEAGQIHVGACAQLGAGVTLLRGASIGAGARVLAGSVVGGSVPPGAVVGGVPARAASELARAGRRSVAEVVRDALGLAALPAPHTPRAQIGGWDSLGALNVLLALEEEFQVSLSEMQVLSVGCVADLERAIASR
jgi:maltose O-acetyltransferase